MIQKTKFKETEIGLIPEEWNVKKLSDLIEVKYGKDHKKLSDGKVPCYGTGGIMRYVNEFLYDKESVLIPRKGSLNNLYYLNKPFWTVDTLFWTKIDEKIMIPKFLFYKLKLYDFVSNNLGSAVPSMTVAFLNEIKIALPPLIEQKAIAKILSDLDSKIELLQQQNKTLEKIGQVLFKQWFVDFEFPNEEGKPYKSSGGKMIDSEPGEIPEGWSVGKLGDLIYVQNGYAFKSSDFLSEGEHGIIKIKNISGNIIDIKNTQYTSDKVISKVDKKFKIESGDLLIAMTGAEVAKVGIVEKNNQSLWLNQRVGLFREIMLGGKIYSYVFLLDESKQSILKSNAHGAAQPNISASQIESLPIITPTKKIIINFFEIFNPAFNKIIGNLNEIKYLFSSLAEVCA